MRKFSPSTLIALLAVFVAIGGTATAASGLINGKKIKPGTVTGKQIKNQSITKAKISTAALAAFAGAQGPQGERGPQGDKGPQGEPGAPGTTAISASATKVAQSPNVIARQLTLDDLPDSRYIVMAEVSVVSQTEDTAEWTNPANNSRTVLWMNMATQPEIDQLFVDCSAGNSSATFKTNITAIPAL
jgi:hypothetical protein